MIRRSQQGFGHQSHGHIVRATRCGKLLRFCNLSVFQDLHNPMTLIALKEGGSVTFMHTPAFMRGVCL